MLYCEEYDVRKARQDYHACKVGKDWQKDRQEGRQEDVEGDPLPLPQQVGFGGIWGRWEA